ncbi:helix-turn-helix domain-containing protein [uncultured Bifidobacterium sp.]|nr:helix-turn-helix domain-containing protein [uncultured Bifidobacterium sp.]
MYDSKSVTVDQIAAMMHVGRSTIYRCLKKNEEPGGKLKNGDKHD